MPFPGESPGGDPSAAAAPPPSPATPPGGSPAAGASGPQNGQPQIGTSPATQPVANRGTEAAGLAMLSLALQGLERALPLLGAGSEPGKAVHQAIGKLAVYVPPGSVPPGIEIGLMQQLMRQKAQMAPQIGAMRAMSQGQPGAGGPPAAPGGGAAPPSPMPQQPTPPM